MRRACCARAQLLTTIRRILSDARRPANLRMMEQTRNLKKLKCFLQIMSSVYFIINLKANQVHISNYIYNTQCLYSVFISIVMHSLHLWSFNTRLNRLVAYLSLAANFPQLRKILPGRLTYLRLWSCPSRSLDT